MPKTIHQTAHFHVPASKVYDALIDEKQHGKFTQSKAKIDPKVGGKFSLFDGWAIGETLELIPGKKIVQSWRGGDWPEGHFSTITFDLKASEGECELHFTQENVPDEFIKDIEQGWIDFYWEPLHNFLNE